MWDHLLRAAALYDRLDLLPTIAARTRAVPGEIAETGVTGELPSTGVDLLIHVAASLKFADRDAAELHQVNVDGTRAVARYSERAGVTRFVHVSTAFVVGRRHGVIREDDPLPRDFHNAYERSKATAERAVREVRPGAAIVRPSVVIGHRATAATMSASGYYTMVKALVQLRPHHAGGATPIGRKRRQVGGDRRFDLACHEEAVTRPVTYRMPPRPVVAAPRAPSCPPECCSSLVDLQRSVSAEYEDRPHVSIGPCAPDCVAIRVVKHEVAVALHDHADTATAGCAGLPDLPALVGEDDIAVGAEDEAQPVRRP